MARPCRSAGTTSYQKGLVMKKVWKRPVVVERPAGMEVTAYMTAKL
jgi:coenzyme PQQ precursor peptide PqqA